MLHVTERITYRFGSSSGRHGIERQLITREPDRRDPDTDIVYEVSRPEVSSPDGVPVDLKVERDRSADRRREVTTFRIGDPDRTVDTAAATYVLEYSVEGAIRSFGDYDELYWDATGFDWDATITRATITAEVPGGARDVSCAAGPVGSTTDCDNAVIRADGAHLLASDLIAGEGVTIGVRIEPGLIADNQPHRVPSAMSRGTIALIVIGVLAAVITVGVPIMGVRKVRKIGRDERYLDLPPGTFPAEAGEPEQDRVGPSPRRLQQPTRLEPPELAVGLSGVLTTGQVRAQDLAATLIQLAVRGAITINDNGSGLRKRSRFRVELVDATRAESASERALLDELFDEHEGDDNTPQVVGFTERRRFREGHRAFVGSVRRSASSGHWFRGSVPSTSPKRHGWILAVILAVLLLAGALLGGQLGPALVATPILVTAVTVYLVRRRSRYGARTARGRAWADQVEGFEQYLAVAEADQLEFEEQEDVFSRYLPWAVAFGLAERWTNVCRRLAEEGRIPAPAAGWYSGADPIPVISGSLFSAGIGAAAAPPPFSGAGFGSGSGFGGGSSFSGGGGFAGGGGGGGGGGSW